MPEKTTKIENPQRTVANSFSFPPNVFYENGTWQIIKDKSNAIDDNGFDSLGRPCWDLYLMGLAFNVSQRSLDPDSKFGAVIVDSDNGILVTGYNSPPSGFDDTQIPLTRPDKYFHMIHAEEAAIIQAAKRGISIVGAKCYVTGKPCYLCLRKLLGCGIKTIVYGNTKFKLHSEDEGSKQAISLMLKQSGVSYKRFKYDNGLHSLISRHQEYLKFKEIGVQETQVPKTDSPLTCIINWFKNKE